MLGSEVPLLVDFGDDWCGPCHAVSPILEEIAKERADRMNVLKLDVDQYPKVAAQLVLVCNTYPEKGGF